MKKIIKNRSRIFNKYQNKSLTLRDRFITQDKKSTDFLNEFIEYIERPKYEDLLHPIQTLRCRMTKVDSFSNYITMFINYFTAQNSCNNDKLKNFEKKLLKSHDEIESIEYTDRDKCIIHLKNGSDIKFRTISSAFDFDEEIPDLLTLDRRGKCHMRSLALANIISNECKCVTGTIWTFISRAKWLHSWLEMDENGKTFCIDNNLNAILSKEDYYKLHHPHVLEIIDQATIDQDIEIINYFNKHTNTETPYIKLYCTSHDEAIEKYIELTQSKDGM